VLPFNGRAAFIGPLVVPGETACLACFVRRRGRRRAAGYALEQCEIVGVAERLAAAVATAVAGLAATIAIRWLGTGEPSLPGAVFVLELDDGVTVTRHRVLRVPRCHACSGTRRLPPPLPWAEAVLR
jgi:bacteriocin biosynthesis cyclodehydratase domain-containing protein